MENVTQQVIKDVEDGKYQIGLNSHQTIMNIPNLDIVRHEDGYYLWSAYAMQEKKREESIGNVLTELSTMVLLEDDGF